MFKAEPFVTRIAFVASERAEAQEARARLAARYGDAEFHRRRVRAAVLAAKV